MSLTPAELPEQSESNNLPLTAREVHGVLTWLKRNDMDLHSAPLEITTLLAREGIYTTIEPRKPIGDLADIKNVLLLTEERETARNKEYLRDNARKALENVNGFGNEEFLGFKLVEILGAVKKVRVEGVDARPTKSKEKKLRGTVFAERVRYTVSTIDEANALMGVFSALLRTNNEGLVYPLSFLINEDGSFDVCVGNLDEYANRVMGNAIEQLVAEDDQKTTGTIFPPDKKDLEEWKKRGETFHPDVEARMRKINQQYLEVLDPESRKYREERGKTVIVLGTDASGIFQAVRDGFRPKIRQLRGGDNLNEEQNPNEDERLVIENKVHLTRDETAPGGQHPEAARALSPLEQTQRSLRRAIEENDTKTEKAVAIAKLVKKAVGAGDTLLDLAMDKLPHIHDESKRTLTDTQKWRKQWEAYERSKAKIVRLLTSPRSRKAS